MIKKTLGSLILGFFCLGISSFTNAVVYITDYGMTLSPSSYSNPLLLENNFKLNSILGNTDKDFFYVVHNYNSSSQGYYTFGWKGDKLYGYSKSVGCSSNTVYQGYVNKIYKCPCGNPYGHSCSSSETYINTFSDCVFYSDFSIPVFQGLIQDISKYGYGMITYNDALNVGNCGPVGFMRTPFDSFENTTDEYWYMIAPDVSDNNNYSLSSTFTVQDVESIINFNISPLNGQGGGGGTTVIRTGKNYYCPTYGELMKTYGMNYNTGLCYNGTMRYLNGSITTVPQQDIFTVFNNDFNNFKQRINVYNNNCIAPATQTQCENAFNGEREKYSIIANAMHNNVDDIGLWNYCNIAQQDPNISTCVANPGEIHKENPTPEELIDYIGRIGDIGMIMTPTTGNILEDLLGEGQTRDDIATRDIFGQLDQIKDKIAGIFEKRSGVDGIIPDYILWLILVSLLLTVLLKK